MDRKTTGRILSIPPQEDTPIREMWLRWMMEQKARILDGSDIQSYLSDGSIRVILFGGSEDHLLRIFESLDTNYLDQGIVIYHVGGIDDSTAERLIGIGAKGIIGYHQPCGMYLATKEYEDAFQSPFFAGLNALQNGKTLDRAYNEIRSSWDRLISVEIGRDIPSIIVIALAQDNSENLFLTGDNNWRAGSKLNLLALSHLEIEPIKSRISIVNISPFLINQLREDPNKVAKLSPDKFEDFIVERLSGMGLKVIPTGSTYSPDGGIDLIAYSESSPFPYLLAAQIKHSKKNRKVSSNVIRDFYGAMAPHQIDIGLVVTNTAFTPDAEWIAERLPKIIRLRGFRDLQKWLMDEQDDQLIVRDMPKQIELTPGLIIPIPWFSD